MKELKRLLVLVLVFAFCLSGLTTYAKNDSKGKDKTKIFTDSVITNDGNSTVIDLQVEVENWNDVEEAIKAFDIAPSADTLEVGDKIVIQEFEDGSKLIAELTESTSDLSTNQEMSIDEVTTRATAKNATKKYTCTYEDYNGNTQTAFIVNIEARYAQSGDDGIDGYILWLRGSCTYSSPFDCEWVGQDTTAGRHVLELEASYYGQSTNIFYSVTYIPWSGGFVMFNASTNGINL